MAEGSICRYCKVSESFVRSGQGVGKTGCEAVLCLWFLSCFPYSRVVATAPTKQQLNDVLWAEVSKWQSKSPLLKVVLRWTKTKVSVVGNEERWFATARTATKPENMQDVYKRQLIDSYLCFFRLIFLILLMLNRYSIQLILTI